jgi:[acyl-carrier-protein] S-malonyltransferase
VLALLFPGQGSQEVGMGRDVCEASEAARGVFEAADAALGFSLSRFCFEGPEEELLRTEIQQPAILTTGIALLRAL